MSLDLQELEDNLDRALNSETPESLENWLREKRITFELGDTVIFPDLAWRYRKCMGSSEYKLLPDRRLRVGTIVHVSEYAINVTYLNDQGEREQQTLPYHLVINKKIVNEIL